MVIYDSDRLTVDVVVMCVKENKGVTPRCGVLIWSG